MTRRIVGNDKRSSAGLLSGNGWLRGATKSGEVSGMKRPILRWVLWGVAMAGMVWLESRRGWHDRGLWVIIGLNILAGFVHLLEQRSRRL